MNFVCPLRKDDMEGINQLHSYESEDEEGYLKCTRLDP